MCAEPKSDISLVMQNSYRSKRFSAHLLTLALAGLSAVLTGCVNAGAQRESTSRGAEAIDVIAFASCAKPNQPETIWRSILATDPDLFLFIGDNVYVDVPRKPKGVEDFERTYAQLASEPGWQTLRAEVPVLATWDDHDYGLNDAGKEFALKQIAQQQFSDFFELPADSPVRQREGIYDAHLFGPEGQRVQVIMLDTRYFRDALVRNPAGRVRGLGPYIPHPHDASTLLGDAQWAWLEAQLEKPADVRVIASSIQVVPEQHGWEMWANFPHERDRLYRLIGSTEARGVVFISGDRHLTEISMQDGPGTPYPMWDFTSSGMNEGGDRRVDEPNRHRVGESRRVANFGVIRIDWKSAMPTLTYETRGKDGSLILEQAVSLDSLKPAAR